jgi:hypothetical protein
MWMQDGCKVSMDCIKWIMFHGHLDYSQTPLLEGRLNTKPGDHGTLNTLNRWFNLLYHARGDHSLLYFAYTCVRDLFIGRVIYLTENIIRWWYFTCKHVSLFWNPLFNMYIFYKIYLQWKYWTLFLSHAILRFILFKKFTLFLSHVVLRFSPVISPRYHVWRPTWIAIHWNSIWLRAQSQMTSYYNWGSVTTLHDFRGVLGRLWTLCFKLSQFHGHGF